MVDVRNLGGTAARNFSRPMELPWGGFFVPHQHIQEDLPMKELAKQYDPSQVEDRIYQFWQ